MAVTVTPYLVGLQKLVTGGIDLDTDTFKMALVTSAYTPDTDAHDFWNDVSGSEVAAGDGYSTGGASITLSVSADTSGNNIDVDCTDVTWATASGLSSRYAVVYKSTGVSSTSPVLLLIDFGGTVLVDGVTINASGLLRFDA
jgi:hypothetical protein